MPLSDQKVTYAVDINILARSKETAKKTMEIDLKINEVETKVITQTKIMTPIRPNAEQNEYNFEQIDSFVYLDTTFIENNNEVNKISYQENLRPNKGGLPMRYNSEWYLLYNETESHPY